MVMCHSSPARPDRPACLVRAACMYGCLQSNWVGEMPLTYGEVTFESLQAVLRRIQHYGGLPRVLSAGGSCGGGSGDGDGVGKGLVFYDLGHGAGGACLASACLYPFAKVAGIEVRCFVFFLLWLLV